MPNGINKPGIFGQCKQLQLQETDSIKDKYISVVDEFINEFEMDDWRNVKIVNVLKSVKTRMETV